MLTEFLFRRIPKVDVAKIPKEAYDPCGSRVSCFFLEVVLWLSLDTVESAAAKHG
ncbi:MAG: hypothetical protein KBD66_02265 [Candidatus Doudnabacteria bacterium]|nr:hypothetical protein [Candidatus Doudnabacteria bacterium]